MPSGAKKRKALKKKKQQEASIGTSSTNNGDNLHVIDEHGSQDDKGSDSNLSSPGSQGNEEFGRKDESAALSSGFGKGSATEVSDVTQGLGPKNGNANADASQGLGPKNGNAIVVERGAGNQKTSVENLPNSSSQNSTHTAEMVASRGDSGLVKDASKKISGDAEDATQELRPKSENAVAVDRGTSFQKNMVEKSSTNYSSQDSTHTAKNGASQDACGSSVSEIVPVVRGHVKPADFVSKGVVSEKSELVENSTQSNLVKQKCDENGANPSRGLENEISKMVDLPRSADETIKKAENDGESEEKRPLLPGPPAVRTSWLSCCGLFDAMTGSDR